MNKRTAAFFVIFAGVLWGIISIFVNALTGFGFSSAQISFMRVFICAVLMLLFLLIYNKNLLKINIKDIWMFIGTGIISLTFFSFCYFTTIVNVEASIAVSLLYTSPVFVMLFSAILFGEKITAKKIAAIILTVAGCCFISGVIGSGAKIGLKSFIIGVGAGLFYALYSIFGRYATRKYHPFTITFYTFVFATVGFLPFVKPVDTINTLAKLPKAIIVVIASGILCGILPYIFYTIGLKHLETTIAGVFAAVEPLVGCLVGIIGFGESAGALKIFGIALILSSIIILSINSGGTAKKIQADTP